MTFNLKITCYNLFDYNLKSILNGKLEKKLHSFAKSPVNFALKFFANIDPYLQIYRTLQTLLPHSYN